jgi:hypothetical protein
VIDPFQYVDPILSMENVTQVVNLISSSADPTLPLENNPNVAHVFLIDTESTMLGGIPPSPVKPPPSNEAILFYWCALTRPRLPSHNTFKIAVQFFGLDVPQTLIDKGVSISILSYISLKYVGCPQLASSSCASYAKSVSF